MTLLRLSQCNLHFKQNRKTILLIKYGFFYLISELLETRILLFRSLVISKRSEKSHKSLLTRNLRFLTSFRNDTFLGNLRNCSLRDKSPNSFIFVMGSGVLIFRTTNITMNIKELKDLLLKE